MSMSVNFNVPRSARAQFCHLLIMALFTGTLFQPFFSYKEVYRNDFLIKNNVLQLYISCGLGDVVT